MMLSFGALEKDRAGVDTGLLTIAKNCYPSTIGYGPMPTLAEYGSNALPSACLGMFFARTNAGSYQVYAGTATKLYKLVAGVWADYSRTVGGAYTTIAGNFWQAAQWGSLLIVVNGSDAPQVIDVDSGATNFTALAGSPPVATHISVVGDFVFLVDANNKRRAINCGTTGPNTATSWTVGVDLCDEYVCPDGGQLVTAPLLGEYGLVLQDGGIARRVILQPGDPVSAFRFEKMEGIKGAVPGHNKVAANGKIYYIAEEGPYSLGPDGANVPIGTQRISEEFLKNCDLSRLDRILGFADPYSSRVYWAYYSNSSAAAYDRLLGYDWMLDRLFFAEHEAAFWAPIVVPGMTLEEVGAAYPNLDAMTISLDSRQFQGGRPTIGAVNASGKLALLTGPTATATLRIAGAHLVPGRRALLSEVYPLGEWGGASLSLRVGKREHAGAATTWVGPFAPSSRTGTIYPRVSSRIHELELSISGAGWTFAQGLQTVEQQDGRQ